MEVIWRFSIIDTAQGGYMAVNGGYVPVNGGHIPVNGSELSQITRFGVNFSILENLLV